MCVTQCCLVPETLVLRTFPYREINTQGSEGSKVTYRLCWGNSSAEGAVYQGAVYQGGGRKRSEIACALQSLWPWTMEETGMHSDLPWVQQNPHHSQEEGWTRNTPHSRGVRRLRLAMASQPPFSCVSVAANQNPLWESSLTVNNSHSATAECFPLSFRKVFI